VILGGAGGGGGGGGGGGLTAMSHIAQGSATASATSGLREV